MKRLIFSALLFFIVANTYSQLDERVFGQIGGTLGADAMMTSGVIQKQSFSSTNINYVTVMFTGRLNILEFSNNMSMSLGVQPTLSVGRAYNSVGGGGNLSVRIPGVFELNFGAASTVSTRKDVGFSIGGGIQFVKYPLSSKAIAVAPNKNNDYLGIYAKWTEPVLVTGIKFFGKHYYCREINMRVSYASIGEVENNSKITENQFITGFQNVGVMLSFLQYINY